MLVGVPALAGKSLLDQDYRRLAGKEVVNLQAEYGGIGAYVGEDNEDHLFTIRQPIYSGPAYKAGLHTDDKIVRIDDWPTATPWILERLK